MEEDDDGDDDDDGVVVLRACKHDGDDADNEIDRAITSCAQRRSSSNPAKRGPPVQKKG